MMNDTMPTPEQAEAITTLSGELVELMARTCKREDLDWLDGVAAAAVACRGLAAHKMANHPELSLDEARQLMLVTFIRILSLPAELVRTVGEDDPNGEVKAIVLPVRKH